MKWVPDTNSNLQGLEQLADLIRHLPVTVLTGAGCSTESGIPDYRGPETRDTHPEPIMYREFVDSESVRRRYWARAMVGWPRFRRAEPNAAHRAIAELEQSGPVRGVITQNVDNLHRRAGSRAVVKLHGSLGNVQCLSCNRVVARTEIQKRLQRSNPDWTDESAKLRPDGDATLPRAVPNGFEIPSCRSCGGILKPDVVFFGENVPDRKKHEADLMLRNTEALVVVGSSLAVRSSYRFVQFAAERRMPVGIINLGPTRGDDRAWIRIGARVGTALPELKRLLC